MIEQKTTLIIEKYSSCLVEFLLKKAYMLHSIKRRFFLFNTDKIEHDIFGGDN